MKKSLKITSYLSIFLLLGVGVYLYINSDESMDTPETTMEEQEESGMEDDNTVEEEEMEEEYSYVDISPQEASTLIADTENLVILDVSNSYDDGHIPGAINYYVGDGSLDEAIPSLDKTVPYLVYCHVDSAAIAGAQKLIDAGFSEVYRLEGNYSAWVDAGYETEK